MRVVTTMPALELSEDAMRNCRIDPSRDFNAYIASVEQAFAELAGLLSGELAANSA
jgi:hypothetical protein